MIVFVRAMDTQPPEQAKNLKTWPVAVSLVFGFNGTTVFLIELNGNPVKNLRTHHKGWPCFGVNVD